MHAKYNRLRNLPEEGRKRLKIMVSACLTGENCKYNGGNNRNRKVVRLMEENEVITVCPEQMGGLPTPRHGIPRRRSKVPGDCQA